MGKRVKGSRPDAPRDSAADASAASVESAEEPLDAAGDAAPGDADSAIDNSIGQLGFDDVLARLREVVDRLEAGNLGLEDSLRVYERGVALARRGHGLLDNAEKRVEILVRMNRDGDAVTAPMPSEDSDANSGPSRSPAR